MDRVAAENARIAAMARSLRLNPPSSYGPGQNVWALEGLSGLNSCCMAGGGGCCDMAAQLQNQNGMSGYGMSDFTSDLVDAVKGALSVIPGASYVGATPENVQMLYDVMTGAKAVELQGKVRKYNERVTALNNALAKINAKGDATERTMLRGEHASIVTEQANYGKLLLEQIDSYNTLSDKVSTYTAGQYNPEKVSAYSLSQLSLPTMSGMNGLGVIPLIPIAVIAVAIAAVLYMAFDTVQAFMNYDLRSKGIEPGLDERYSGFMGKINRITDSIGDVMTVGMIVGAAALGYMIWKKKWIFAEKGKATQMIESFKDKVAEIAPAIAGS